MSFSRAIFAFALVMLVVGFFTSRMVADYLFGNAPAQAISVVAETSTRTPTPTPAPTASPTARTRTLPTASPTIRVPPTRTPTVRPTATIVPSPTPTPTTGVVTLARYWVGSQAVRRGRAVAIGYVISNGTGHTVRIFLGASVKLSRFASWSASLSDTADDVVAVVPPGVSTHVRYFAFPARARSGSYDVAWGLRNAASGVREALVTAAGAIVVTR